MVKVIDLKSYFWESLLNKVYIISLLNLDIFYLDIV